MRSPGIVSVPGLFLWPVLSIGSVPRDTKIHINFRRPFRGGITMEKATRKYLAQVAEKAAQTPFHGYIEGKESNLDPIIR